MLLRVRVRALVLAAVSLVTAGAAGCTTPEEAATEQTDAPRGFFRGEPGTDAPASRDAIDFYDASHFFYWPPGCGLDDGCARHGSYAFDPHTRALTLRPDEGPPRTVDLVARAPGLDESSGPRTLLEGSPARLLEPCDQTRSRFTLGGRMYERIAGSDSRATFQAAVEKQLRELTPGAGEHGPVVHTSPSNPASDQPRLRAGERRLFFQGRRLAYWWRRPGGLDVHYAFALADAPTRIVAEATATTECDNPKLLPQDHRCGAANRRARFTWRHHDAVSELHDVAACERNRAADRGLLEGRPLTGLQVLILPMRYDRFGPEAPDTNTFVAYAVRLQEFYRTRGADAVYELLGSAPEDLFERLERFRAYHRKYDRIIFLGHGGGDGLLWDRHWEQIGLNWPNPHPDLRADQAPPGVTTPSWPYSYWPTIDVETDRQIAAPDPPREVILSNAPAFDRLMALTKELLRPGAWVYLGTCNGAKPSSLHGANGRPFVEVHACGTGATTFGLAGPQGAPHSAENIMSLETALLVPEGVVTGSPQACAP